MGGIQIYVKDSSLKMSVLSEYNYYLWLTSCCIYIPENPIPNHYLLIASAELTY